MAFCFSRRPRRRRSRCRYASSSGFTRVVHCSPQSRSAGRCWPAPPQNAAGCSAAGAWPPPQRAPPPPRSAPAGKAHPHRIHHLLTIRAAANAAHQPFGPTALDPGAGGENGFRHAMHLLAAADRCSGRRGEAIVSDGWRVGRWFWLPEAWCSSLALTPGATFPPLFYRSLLGRAQRTGAFDIP